MPLGMEEKSKVCSCVKSPFWAFSGKKLGRVQLHFRFTGYSLTRHFKRLHHVSTENRWSLIPNCALFIFWIRAFMLLMTWGDNHTSSEAGQVGTEAVI